MKARFIFALASIGFCLVYTPTARAKTEPPSNPTYPQIVRLGLAEGDVRISRGKQEGKAKDADWEKAVSGLPLESGFSLATGDGRAEIELEDASTLYLAPNSVLVCNDLHTQGDIPHTELALLTGTVTLHVVPYVPGELFVLRTPTDTLSVSYRGRSDLRVTSYMDAVAITSLNGGLLRLSKTTEQLLTVGQTTYYRAGRRINPAAHAGDNDELAGWNKWVAARFAGRNAATAKMLNDSELAGPVPGLAQLAGQGEFFACAPYGTCWEPAAASNPDEQSVGIRYLHGPAAIQASTSSVFRGTFSGTGPQGYFKPVSLQMDADSAPSQESQAQTPVPLTGTKKSAASSLVGSYAAYEPYFPCGPDALDYRLALNRYAVTPADYESWLNRDPWRWAVCHSGSWIYHQNRYAWVPGKKRHHTLPIRWVKSGRTVGYVPIHPLDEKGKLPVNREHGFVAVTGKNHLSVEQINLNSGSEVKLLESPPREFRKDISMPLARAEAPRMEARLIAPAAIDKAAHGTAASMPIVFDHKSQSFMMTREISQGGNTKAVFEPVGAYLARTGGTGFGGVSRNTASFAGGGAFTGAGASRGGSGFSGASSAGGGGGSHSSGVSSGGGGGGGGGSHSGGYSGGGASSGGGGGASSAGGGGGGHH